MTEVNVVDSNGNELVAGDSVTIIQNLKPKGAKDIKKGTAVKNIRLIDGDSEAIEGRVDGVVMVIKTCFVKKLSKKK
ncbi:MAG: alkylphosphonate utilization protein [candidate division SR1 bacterium]|nr:alkylphosphonate utilization protein [candidate division SR1 bacterium]